MARSFSATLTILERFVSQLAANERALATARDSMTEEQLKLGGNGKVEDLRQLCEELVLQAAECETIDALRDIALYETFASRVSVPPRLLQSGDLSNLIRFISSASKAEESRMLRATQAAVDASDRMLELRAAASAEVTALVDSSRMVLAASDHLPIYVTLRGRCRGGCHWGFHVTSHNVQELVEDGINVYVSALPFISGFSGAKELRKRLVDAMLSDAVVEAQQQAVARLLEEQLNDQTSAGSRAALSDAVCLQEVGVPLLAFLREYCAQRGLHMHASAGTEPVGAGDVSARTSRSCAAITCIVSPRAFQPLDDVAVNYSTKSRTRTRRFAAVAFEGGTAREAQQPPLALVSVHVLHSFENCGRDQPSNAEYIAESVRALGQLASETLVRGGVVLAVGDFNGPPTPGVALLQKAPGPPPLTDLDYPPLTAATALTAPNRAADEVAGATATAAIALDATEVRTSGLCCSAREPETPTQLGRPLAVDGAIAMHTCAEEVSLECLAFERLADGHSYTV